MGMVFLIVFTLAELTLVVLTFTKFREKAAWLKNRAIIRAAETALLLGILLVPATHMKWRFFCAMGIIAIRFLFAGVMWLVKRGKATGLKKRAWSVVNCVLSVILIAAALVPSFLFANYNGLPATGDFKVGVTDTILVDNSRVDSFETDGSFVEVPAHFYYPETAEGSFPLIIFSHGAFGYYQSNFSTYEELASNGYVVVALDHPHHSFFSKNTEGKTIAVDSGFMNDAMTIGSSDTAAKEEIFTITEPWMALRVSDESFVIDAIKEAKESGALSDAWHTDNDSLVLSVLDMTDTGKIGAMGHSLGGAASVELGRERKDIDAVIDLDGTALGEITGVTDDAYVLKSEAYPVPVLVFAHGSSSDDGITANMVENAKDGKLVTCPAANHMDFTDLSMLSPAISEMLSGPSGVDHETFLQDVNGAVLNWFDVYLKNEGTLQIRAEY